MPFKNAEESRAYGRKHYAEKKEVYARRNKKSREKLKEILRDAKAKPCSDCGTNYPHYVMDFDHVRGEKLYNVSEVWRIASQRKLLAEIAKCDVVCSNCHRQRTWSRRHDDSN